MDVSPNFANELFIAIAEGGFVPGCVYRCEHGRLEVNENLVRLLNFSTSGQDSGETVDVGMITAPELVERDTAIYDGIARGGEPRQWETELTGGDGSRVQAQMAGVPGAAGAAHVLVFAKDSVEDRHSLVSWLLTQHDEDRRTISRRLHDATAQNLAALSMNLSMMTALIRENPQAGTILTECANLVSHALSDIRSVAYSLHPPLLDELGLETALRSYAQAFESLTAIHTILEIPDAFPRLPSETESSLFRIVQEYLSFLHRNGDPTECRVTLNHTSDADAMVISDNGTPFAPDSPSGELSLALLAMRERARQIGGRVTILAQPHGTTIRVIIARS